VLDPTHRPASSWHIGSTGEETGRFSRWSRIARCGSGTTGRTQLLTSWVSRKLETSPALTNRYATAGQQPREVDLAPQNAPRRWAAHRFAVRNTPLTWVELSGLEPLTSCMPSQGRTSTRVSLCRSPSRDVPHGLPESARVDVLPCCIATEPANGTRHGPRAGRSWAGARQG
jgi:hypothetical protein